MGLVGFILVLLGVIMAVVDAFAPRARLLHVAVILIGLGVLLGAESVTSLEG